VEAGKTFRLYSIPAIPPDLWLPASRLVRELGDASRGPGCTALFDCAARALLVEFLPAAYPDDRMSS